MSEKELPVDITDDDAVLDYTQRERIKLLQSMSSNHDDTEIVNAKQKLLKDLSGVATTKKKLVIEAKVTEQMAEDLANWRMTTENAIYRPQSTPVQAPTQTAPQRKAVNIPIPTDILEGETTERVKLSVGDVEATTDLDLEGTIDPQE